MLDKLDSVSSLKTCVRLFAKNDHDDDHDDDEDDDDDVDDDDDDKVARAKIIAFYEKHNPSKVRDVDALILKYRDVGVGASELLLAVQKKYAKSNAAPSPKQFSV